MSTWEDVLKIIVMVKNSEGVFVKAVVDENLFRITENDLEFIDQREISKDALCKIFGVRKEDMK